MTKIILVEGKDDKAFIEALLNANEIEINEIEVNSDMGGLSMEGLIKALTVARNKIRKFGISKIGIIIDLDNSTNEERIKFLNECINKVFGVVINPNDNNAQFSYEGLTVTISCHFISYGGVGELEGYLMHIASSDKKYSNCLMEWRKCIGDGEISDKEFRKLWVHYYVRWDISTHQEREQAGKYCTLDYALKNKRGNWNFNSDALNPIKEYLTSFTV